MEPNCQHYLGINRHQETRHFPAVLGNPLTSIVRPQKAHHLVRAIWLDLMRLKSNIQYE